MQSIKEIKGKTIKDAKWNYGEFSGCDNRSFEFQFTDGTTFSVNIESRCSGEALVFKNGNDEKPKVVRKL